MADGKHEVKYVAADGTESSDLFFTGTGPISFGDLQKNFGGSGTPSNVKIGDFLRDTNKASKDPKVPNSAVNQNVKTSKTNMLLSNYRNTLKKIKVTLAEATVLDYNGDAVWHSTSSTVNQDISTGVPTFTSSGSLEEELEENTPKQQVINSNTTIRATSVAQLGAMVWDSSKETNNLEILVKGKIQGFSGLRGAIGSEEGSAGGDAGHALYINPNTSSGEIKIKVDGGEGAIWGGGGGGAGGYEGEDGEPGKIGSPGKKGESNSTECEVNYTEETNWEWSRKNYIRYWWRERCKRRRGWWATRRRHRKHRSRCEENEWTRTRCTGYYSGHKENGKKGHCEGTCDSAVRSGEAEAELTGTECITANRNRCESKLKCKYESKASITADGGSAGRHGNIGNAGEAGRGSHGGHGAGAYSSGNLYYKSGETATAANPPTKGNKASNPNCEGGEGESRRCWEGWLKSAREKKITGHSGKDCTPSKDGKDGKAGSAGGDGGDWGQSGSSVTKGSRTVSGGRGGFAVYGGSESTRYSVTTSSGGKVKGST